VPLSVVSQLEAIIADGPSRWTEEVRSVISELETLNHTTESDFLAVGGNLMAFLSASRQLHDEIAGLSAMVSGEQAQHACDALVSVRGYAREMKRRSKEVDRALLKLRVDADRIRKGFSAFGEIASSFRIVAVQARIEAAHLATSQQNIKNLADDVQSCSDHIRASADKVLKVATDFDSRIAATLLEVSGSEAVRVLELPSLLAQVDADVEVFQSRQRESVEVSGKLAEQMDSVTRGLCAVATSIQFHDITRQQVEHVIGALEGFLRDATASNLLSPGADVLKLQRAQLKSAAAAFDLSAKKIACDLEGIAARVGEMVDASNCMHDFDREERNSFLGGMQNRLAGIAQAVGQLHSLELGTSTVLAELQRSREALGVAVSEVQSMELELTLISVNAIVSARQIGPRGETLKAIAGYIRELRLQSAERSGGAKTALDSIGECIESLGVGDASGAAGASIEMLLDNLNTRMQDLQAAGISGAAAAARVVDLAHRLCADLNATRDGFGIGRLFAETVVRCCGLLDVIASRAPQSGAPDAPFAEKMSDERYTMETERYVHRAVAGNASHIPVEEESNALAGEFGEYVEFF
jgi:hypothetical protein